MIFEAGCTNIMCRDWYRSGDVARTPGRDDVKGTAEDGYLYCGSAGAGHCGKMVHNGIEYGLMQAMPRGSTSFATPTRKTFVRECGTGRTDREKLDPSKFPSMTMGAAHFACNSSGARSAVSLTRIPILG
jgi:hypothetical protein